MASKTTLAQNHLSGLARKGRGGDTKLRVIDGELSHVNSGEAALADVYGRLGEGLVKDIGSGTINPNTGLREYVDPVSLAMLGFSVIGGLSEHGMMTEEARAQSRLSALEIREANKALEALDPAKEAKMDIRRAEYQFELEGLSEVSESKSVDLERQTAQLYSKSDFATSGEVKGREESMMERVRKGFERGSETLIAALGKGYAETEEWFAGETSRLQSIKKRAQLQKDQADRASKRKYLGIF